MTTATPIFTLKKEERVCRREDRALLFGNDSKRKMFFPLRVFYRMVPQREGQPAVMMMVSVPKRCFKRAVKRNRVKRQVREAYRHLKHALTAAVAQQQGRTLLVAFVWCDKELYPSTAIHNKMEKALCYLSDSVTAQQQD